MNSTAPRNPMIKSTGNTTDGNSGMLDAGGDPLPNINIIAFAVCSSTVALTVVVPVPVEENMVMVAPFMVFPASGRTPPGPLVTANVTGMPSGTCTADGS